jgi:hypothetical protein
MKHLVFFCCSLLIVLDCRAYQANDAAQAVLSDGSYADTAQAVAYAAGKGQDGWVVTVGVPGGTYVWSSSLILGMNNSITIQGASTNNRPTIIFNTGANSGIYSRTYNHLVTIQNFIFNVGAQAPISNIIGIDGGGVCFRVSNCEFLQPSRATFGVQVGSINNDPIPGPYGLVDHCQFYFPGNVVYNYLNVRANGNISHWGWTQPMTWGTTNSVVVEDCAFSQPRSLPISHIVEADGGARICIRYCNVTNLAEGTHGVQSGAHDSTLQVECYENNFVVNDSTGIDTMPYLFWQRGGTCVVWSNTVSTTSFWNLGKVCEFTVECAESANWQSESCGRQLMYPADYPGYQQVGQGVVNGAPGSDPIYCWGNNFPGTAWGDYVLGLAEDNSFIAQGRDIFLNTPKPGYTALVYPHPLVASGGNVPASFPASTPGNGSVVPPTDLQAHPTTN